MLFERSTAFTILLFNYSNFIAKIDDLHLLKGYNKIKKDKPAIFDEVSQDDLDFIKKFIIDVSNPNYSICDRDFIERYKILVNNIMQAVDAYFIAA